ncbi:hypothetical protein HNR06_004887 [Nocardiopsis arvandica]|uniref:DUF3137 domain-containing protein n=1 Tax=Nocardiopsis sinuspersici TaxID=501010 RepID=A0A7Y9XGJ8_9ACTN|nr:hypothetical protein [Nocardiopsis sinuspersici]NYH55298.1 hypothetical protein [Nocardiopsis sinuspersici]
MEIPTVLVLVIAALVVVVVGVMVFAGSAAERHRSRALSAWAERRGWRYDRERPELVDRFHGAPFLERGSDARARHVLCAEWRGRRVVACEYGCTAAHLHGRDRTAPYVYTVVVVTLPEAVPLLQVEPVRGSPDTPSPPAGAHPWVSGQEEFDACFRVATVGDAFAGTVLGEGTRTWLLSRQGFAPFCFPFRFAGQYLLSWERGRLDTGRVQARADAVIDLLERIPTGVWEGTQDSVG